MAWVRGRLRVASGSASQPSPLPAAPGRGQERLGQGVAPSAQMDSVTGETTYTELTFGGIYTGAPLVPLSGRYQKSMI